MPKVVIVMPAYRAVRTLEKTVAAIPAGVADELLLVDDASPDGTADLARRLGLRVHVHASNQGYGGNQKTCYTQALKDGADIVVLLHPDYQHEPEAVPLLIAPILAGRADMAFGSRFAGLGDPKAGGMPRYRFLGNRLTTLLENLMLGSRFTETHSGMRAYTRDCLHSLPFLAYSDDFAFDSQLLVDAVTSGQLVVEVPIPTRYTKESSSIGMLRSFRYVASSLTYCARRVGERGRRGRRNPVVRSAAIRSRSPLPRLLSLVTEGRAKTREPERGSNAGSIEGVPPEGLGYLVRGARVVNPRCMVRGNALGRHPRRGRGGSRGRQGAIVPRSTPDGGRRRGPPGRGNWDQRRTSSDRTRSCACCRTRGSDPWDGSDRAVDRYSLRAQHRAGLSLRRSFARTRRPSRCRSHAVYRAGISAAR